MTTMLINPMLASGALQFAFEKATIEGKITIGSLFILSMFSWTIIITKFRQLSIARRAAKKFFAAYGATRLPALQPRGRRTGLPPQAQPRHREGTAPHQHRVV
jgi:hypothetical protein